jgi:exonuclease VII small subunit
MNDQIITLIENSFVGSLKTGIFRQMFCSPIKHQRHAPCFINSSFLTRAGFKKTVKGFFMFKKAFLIIAILAPGITGFVRAQDATSTAAKPITTQKLAPMRFVYLKDRIKNQRLRIDKDLAAGILTAPQAETCRALLDNVEGQIKADREANSGRKTMAKESYESYNSTLDRNSGFIKEQKDYFYSYGPLDGTGDYYDDQYPEAETPTPNIFSPPVKTGPGIFELKDRLKAQRARIHQYLATNALSNDQAKHCEAVLDAARYQMNVDFTANGSHQLTKNQSAGINAMLDANSTVIQESRIYYYYYNDSEAVQ